MGVRGTGWVVGMLAGMLFMEGRQTVPHFVDENGNPFRLRFAAMRVESSRPTVLRSSFLHDGWSALDDRPLVPVPAWSLPEVSYGRAEADGIFLLEDEVRFQTGPVGLAACGLRSATSGTDCGY